LLARKNAFIMFPKGCLASASQSAVKSEQISGLEGAESPRRCLAVSPRACSEKEFFEGRKKGRSKIII
jgi:hypothetical protein